MHGLQLGSDGFVLLQYKLLLPFAFCVNYCGSIGSDGCYEW